MKKKKVFFHIALLFNDLFSINGKKYFPVQEYLQSSILCKVETLQSKNTLLYNIVFKVKGCRQEQFGNVG